MGLTHKRHIGDLVSFWKSKEWGPELLEQIVQTQGVEVILAPAMRGWEALDEPFFADLWKLLTQRYELLYLDLQPSLLTWVWDFLESQIDSLIGVLTVDPSSFSAYEQVYGAISKTDR